MPVGPTLKLRSSTQSGHSESDNGILVYIWTLQKSSRFSKDRHHPSLKRGDCVNDLIVDRAVCEEPRGERDHFPV